MPWTFDIREVSAGCYKTSATRDSGQSIAKDGFESVIEELLADVYRAEVDAGTLDSKAAYDVTLDFLGTSRWEGRYHEKMFGSWSILDRRDQNKAVHYDGRDFYLMVSKDSNGYSWQGELKQLAKGRCHYFREVVYL